MDKMLRIKDNNILFIAPKFYNYHNDIISHLQQKDAKVAFFTEDIYTPLYRFLNRIIPSFALLLKNNYLNRILDNIGTNTYDIIFVIRGGILSPEALNTIKLKLPQVKLIMYQWDSNAQSNYSDKIKYFDSVQTFDKKDALKYNLEYLPLYYTKQYEDIFNSDKIKEYDLVFYGSYHSDRLEIIKNFDKLFIDYNLKFKYHLYITKMSLFRLMVSGKIRINDLKYLKTYAVDNNIILDDYRKTTTVLDIELNIQSGLTMRTFEALGSGLNLITTNKSIKDEIFYNDENIMIIDRNKLNINLSFFKINNQKHVCITNYSFENWISKVFK